MYNSRNFRLLKSLGLSLLLASCVTNSPRNEDMFSYVSNRGEDIKIRLSGDFLQSLSHGWTVESCKSSEFHCLKINGTDFFLPRSCRVSDFYGSKYLIDGPMIWLGNDGLSGNVTLMNDSNPALTVLYHPQNGITGFVTSEDGTDLREASFSAKQFYRISEQPGPFACTNKD